MIDDYLNIDNAQTFDEVVESRTFTYKAMEAGRIRLSFLATMYKDPTHFIFELLQNAEDANATEVSFNLLEDRLVFSHNGPKLFDHKDLVAITGYADSNKTKVTSNYGKFGLGFKAVFSICKTPQIYSGEMCFEIKNYIVPCKIRPNPEYKDGTYFVLPFESDDKSVANIFRLILAAISNLSSDCLLFTNNIRTINWVEPNNSGRICKTYIEKEKGVANYCRIEYNGMQTNSVDNYLVFSRHAAIDNKNISIAYSLDETSSYIVKNGSTKISVLFPTEKDSLLSFKLDAPFEPTQTRESIYENENTENELNMILDLYHTSLLRIQKYGLYNVDFIDCLPFEYNKFGNYFYDAFYKKTMDFFKQCDSIPTSSGEIKSKEDCVLARGANIIKLINSDDLQNIFNKKYWVIDGITRDVKSNIFKFFNTVLGIKVIDLEDLIKALNADSIMKKDYSWFESFYELCNQSGTTIIKYKHSALVLTESGDVKSVLNDANTPNVFLPSSSTSLFSNNSHIVNINLSKTEAGKRFFTTMGISEEDIVDYIRDEWIPDLKKSNDSKTYFETLTILYEEYTHMEVELKKKLEEIFSNELCILASNFENEDKVFISPHDCYFNSDENRILYQNAPQVYYLSNELQEYSNSNQGFRDFLIKIGVNENLKFELQYDELSSTIKEDLRNNKRYSTEENYAYEIKYLDKILDSITEERSKILWASLKNVPNEYQKGIYKWKYYNVPDSVTFKSYFYYTLDEKCWLYDKDGQQVCPRNITYRQITSIYGNNDNLLINLSFMDDIVSKLPEEIKQVVALTTKGVPIEILRQAAELYLAQQGTSSLILTNPTDGESVLTIEAFHKDNGVSNTEVVESELGNVSTSVLGTFYEDVFGSNNILGEVDRTITSTYSIKENSDVKQRLGEWGEKKVISALKQQYEAEGYEIFDDTDNYFTGKNNSVIEVKRQNITEINQKGYDILIKENNSVISYIEVKTKRSLQSEAFLVHGAQWDMARKLYNEGNGDKYYIYVVYYNSEVKQKTKINIIRNPYKEWLDGNLKTDPVNIIV